MNKKTCYITNPSFGKSRKDDLLSVKQMNTIIDTCEKNDCREIVICGGMYSFSKKQAQDIKYVKDEFDFVSKNFPKRLNINYKILSGESEIFVLNKHLFDMNKKLSRVRGDVEDLGFDRKETGKTLLKCRYGKQNNLGFNEGEVINIKGHTYDPSIRLNNIIKKFDGDLVIIGGKNRFEEFVYDNKIVVALPSIMNPNRTNNCPDIGFIMVKRDEEMLDVKPYVKLLNQKPNYKKTL